MLLRRHRQGWDRGNCHEVGRSFRRAGKLTHHIDVVQRSDDVSEMLSLDRRAEAGLEVNLRCLAHEVVGRKHVRNCLVLRRKFRSHYVILPATFIFHLQRDDLLRCQHTLTSAFTGNSRRWCRTNANRNGASGSPCYTPSSLRMYSHYSIFCGERRKKRYFGRELIVGTIE